MKKHLWKTFAGMHSCEVRYVKSSKKFKK